MYKKELNWDKLRENYKARIEKLSNTITENEQMNMEAASEGVNDLI